ncbi:hypothetical protein AA0113_g11883 [Alternaria arborescens]|uniref:Uncharacterized protein n=1 Tax=Alternaria arborescens TaxID=156630 RepID=A0A4Q4Q1A1_9PLEO|nr:hypothetical protein AA0111_g4248 [Alternaria arborescens]RYN42579.1 hypothetical protein AA0112_g1596 [Alternaria arborescens]RYO31179.1 hypothetical protein AA0113_g11883 [Alternaria arborescens]RYO32501.1 hypothetical protein AA0111_g4248 [Alternaria arborescens]
MKSTTLLATTLSALVASVPVHVSSSLLPLPSTPVFGSGMMLDNMPLDNNLPGGGIGSLSPKAIHDKRALVKEVSDTLDSSTYYDAAAEKEAEELALVLDAASENVAEIEGADDDVKVNR